jgi:uncharacterized membrane protein YkvA (DUF1232 family)
MNWRKWWGRLNKASLWRALVAVWYLVRDKRTPLAPKLLAWSVLAYALSPIDLIPDFIPVLGYVDDVLLLPVLIWFTIRLLPPEVLADCRDQADSWMRTQSSKPSSRVGAVVIVLLWIAVGAAIWMGLVQPRL